MTKVSEKEMESLSAQERELAESIAAKQKVDDKARRAKFVAKCEEGKIDADCILKTNDTLSYIGCFTK
jgi:hypothetical protein